jgi:transcription antitermination factor NusG
MSTRVTIANNGVERLLNGALAEQSNPNWYVVCTMPRHEKQVAAQLNGRSIENFLPLYEEVHRWKDRRMKVLLPLFPGYVFVRVPLMKRLGVQMVPGVLRFVGFGGPPVALESAEMERLRAGLTMLHAEPHPFLKIGQKVRVKCGPLAGVEGILEQYRGRFRVILSMDLIQKSVAVEVDMADLQIL